MSELYSYYIFTSYNCTYNKNSICGEMRVRSHAQEGSSIRKFARKEYQKQLSRRVQQKGDLKNFVKFITPESLLNNGVD